VNKTFDPIVVPLVDIETVRSSFDRSELGQWYWLRNGEGAEKILACITHVGSNFVEVKEPSSGRGYRHARVHRNQFEAMLTAEPNAGHFIRERISHYQKALADNMAEIQRLTESLGLAPQLNHSSGDADGKSLAILSGQVDVEDFKKALITAQKETLPALFKRNEDIAGELSRWMGAESLPMLARLEPMKESVKGIEDRLFNIQLYAGMMESVVIVSEGRAASRDERLKVMQRRLYMDEECLLAYESGGMEFKDIHAFDSWLAKPENRDRVLPFQRCMVSMKVRRITKERSTFGSMLSLFVNINAAEDDRLTFLFVRNGEQIYRISTPTDFGELMFPDRAVFDPSEPMMVMVESGSAKIKRMITRREFDSLLAEGLKKEALFKNWFLENPEEEWKAKNPNSSWGFSNPHRDDAFSGRGWEPFDDSSVYFDEALKTIQAEIKEYNRVALVVQGLFDRTKTLMPHNPVQMWKPRSFAQSVELVYDHSMALMYGDAPDISAYVQTCNAQITVDSVIYGQEDAWMISEAGKENRRTDNNWRLSREQRHYYERLRPYGDQGPGRVALMSSWKPRSKVAIFTWERERRNSHHQNDLIKSSISVPVEKLFNVSAYRLGDFKRFFADPRTREQYLTWAPMLLSAEDYHQGKLDAQEPV
jgi:hypothetical protein